MADDDLKDFHIICPCCDTKILVHGKSRAVLGHERPGRATSKSFEELAQDVTKRKTDAEDIFSQAVREHQNREELLDKKFKEAFERAKNDDSPPPKHPLDYD